MTHLKKEIENEKIRKQKELTKGNT